jgi:hypothetical protein
MLLSNTEHFYTEVMTTFCCKHVNMVQQVPGPRPAEVTVVDDVDLARLDSRQRPPARQPRQWCDLQQGSGGVA